VPASYPGFHAVAEIDFAMNFHSLSVLKNEQASNHY
jgi:hypothetical protein